MECINVAFTNISRDAANLMKTFASIKLPRKNKEGGYDMCKAIADLMEENQRLGRAELLVEQVKDGVITIEYASKNLGITKEELEKLMKNKEKQQ